MDSPSCPVPLLIRAIKPGFDHVEGCRCLVSSIVTCFRVCRGICLGEISDLCRITKLFKYGNFQYEEEPAVDGNGAHCINNQPKN